MRICVFCGSQFGVRDAYREAAVQLGRSIAQAGIGLVYGGATVGLMGVVADAALAHGGEVVGVMPESGVTREIAHRGLSELHFVKTMHERKAKMASLADAFVALPGGIGTLDELFDMWTWRALGLHDKPLALLDVDGYYEKLRAFLDHTTEEGFLRGEGRALLWSDDNPGRLVARVRAEAARAAP